MPVRRIRKTVWHAGRDGEAGRSQALPWFFNQAKRKATEIRDGGQREPTRAPILYPFSAYLNLTFINLANFDSCYNFLRLPLRFLITDLKNRIDINLAK
jgi:hypothetical protein